MAKKTTKRHQIDLTDVNYEKLEKAVERCKANGAKETISTLANSILAERLSPSVANP